MLVMKVKVSLGTNHWPCNAKDEIESDLVEKVLGADIECALHCLHLLLDVANLTLNI